MLIARLYVDPTCCHTWHAMEPIARLRREFGPILDFDFPPGPGGALHRTVVSRFAQAALPSHPRLLTELWQRGIAITVAVGRESSGSRFELVGIRSGSEAEAARQLDQLTALLKEAGAGTTPPLTHQLASRRSRGPMLSS